MRIAIVVGLFFTASTVAQTKVDFGRDIQPILSENCYFCHGPDPQERKADLRLDIEEGARDWFEPGSPEESELFLRISTDDPLDLMPPANSHRQLTAEQIELIRVWIEQGGKWGQHWSFAPIENPIIEQQATSNPIDTFVEAKLAEHDLKLSPEADRRTLIRRVSIDLNGLPPTLEQIDEYLSDNSPDAYAKMVDRFLASPRYGERMAWNWLDAARYADSNGYQGDNERTMWPWRDWVINSFNENMPFDQFSKWQIAGDLLPNATDEQILATAFNRNHPINGEGGRIAEENRIDYVMDMAETAGTVWMGLTLNCCRCHDHKYDQLSQKDYYRFAAFFDQTPVTGEGGNAQTPPVLAVPTPQQRNRLTELVEKVTETRGQLTAQANKLLQSQAKWEAQYLAEAKGRLSDWSVFKPTQTKSQNTTVEILGDQSILATGESPENDVYVLTGTTDLHSVRGFRLEALPHPSHTQGGLAKSPSSNFVLTGISVRPIRPGEEAVPIEISQAFADHEQPGHPIQFAIDDDSQSGWAVLKPIEKMSEPREAIFVFSEEVEIPAGASLELTLSQESIHQHHNIGRFRISLTDQQPQLVGVLSNLLDAINTPLVDRTDEQAKTITAAMHDDDANYVRLKHQLETQQAKLDRLNQQTPKVMVMADMPEPRRSFLLNRGSYQEPQDEVFPNVPELLVPIPENVKRNRLALANWLFSNSNPLTARVTVNRMWATIFGTGLVKTTEDFGVQGEPPSHPQLLDWLAAEYRDSGWNTKYLYRVILNSRTYRQSARTNPHLLELDPENRLLARAPRYRMPSWMLRDYALAASGRLVQTQGGAPVNGYQPEGVWEEASFGNKKYQRGTGDELYRRSIHTFWRRIAAPTMFFDNADRMTCSVKAFRTNTPLHALTTLNDTTFVEAARILATQAIHQHQESNEERLNFLFERILARFPDRDERKILLAAVERTQKQFTDDASAAKEFASIGETPIANDIDIAELAAWTSLGLAVLNLDEALTRQ